MSRPMAQLNLRETSDLQRYLWHSGESAAQARALRITGEVDDDRLLAAVDAVVEAMEVLRVAVRLDDGVPVTVPADVGQLVRHSVITGPASQRDERCVVLLRQDRDDLQACANPLVRFHLCKLGVDHTVLGLVAHPIMLDLRSVYLVLGAVVLEYFGRFRPEQFPRFAELVATDPVPAGVSRSSRSQWWTRRLQRWRPAAPGAGPAASARTETIELVVGDDRWRRLGELGGSGGNAGALAMIALLAWSLQRHAGLPRPPVFAASLDLRDYLGLGPAVGPLTDRVLFAVEPGAARAPFRELMLRTHAGLLDSVVHYLPYAELAGIAAGSMWDVEVSYCPHPPASGNTRGEAQLASRGLSIELFAESALARSSRPAQGMVDVHFAESARGMTLVLNFDADGRSAVRDLTRGVDAAIDKVLADPDVPIAEL